jgi:hypothetical protein
LKKSQEEEEEWEEKEEEGEDIEIPQTYYYEKPSNNMCLFGILFSNLFCKKN